MRRPGHNHLDRSLRLRPRDYAENPHAFGTDPRVRFDVPEGGDARSAQIAKTFHDLIVTYRACDQKLSGAELGRRFGFSAATWSRSTTGQRWPCNAVTAALFETLRRRPQPPAPQRPARTTRLPHGRG